MWKQLIPRHSIGLILGFAYSFGWRRVIHTSVLFLHSIMFTGSGCWSLKTTYNSDVFKPFLKEEKFLSGPFLLETGSTAKALGRQMQHIYGMPTYRPICVMLAYLSVKDANVKHPCERKKENAKWYVVLPALKVYYNLQLFVFVIRSETFQQILKLVDLRKSILSFSFQEELASTILDPFSTVLLPVSYILS